MGLTACDPAPPPVFTVNTAGTAGDANPGDGRCEVTPGAGDCTGPAAVEEAHAAGRAEVVLPDLDGVELSGEITAQVHLRGNSRWTWVDATDLRVQAGARVTMTNLSLQSPAHIEVAGTLTMNFMAMDGWPEPTDEWPESLDEWDQAAIHVTPTGQLNVINSMVGGLPAIDNHGITVSLYSLISGGNSAGALSTTPGATSLVGGSILVAEVYGRPGAEACTGQDPASLGYNVVSDASCSLGGTGDVNNYPDSAFWHEPNPVTLDAIPVGELGCGTTFVDSFFLDPRPVDGDGDGIAACDMGPWEYHEHSYPAGGQGPVAEPSTALRRANDG